MSLRRAATPIEERKANPLRPSGALSRPFAKCVAQGHGATVVLRGGTYYLPETLVLTPQDSGAQQAPVTWRLPKARRPSSAAAANGR